MKKVPKIRLKKYWSTIPPDKDKNLSQKLKKVPKK